MNVFRLAASVLATGLILAASACSSPSTKTGADDAGVSAGAGGAGAAISSATPAQSRIYFDYRQASLDGADQTILDGWATYLKANARVRVSLEGHGDERGSAAVNLAIGDSRASNANAYLVRAGVAAMQLSVTSHGKSRPAAAGHDEAAWSQNRRVEITLR